ncbi:DUF255 domain-containing protein [Halobacterium salinarum]|uniref:DUF255 domain-containing protein n=1 Tax=Halobacterium salinarum TaxID=2242 RepID=UPI002552F5B5|nr:DUF255 domain-containing protein [Halobacterium salinarum]MDL0139370.1 DUF255 domain-containing protein [Halobacterium salinarum]
MSDASDDRTRVEWREWGSDAFADARERGVPLLVSVVATWSESCRAMAQRTYAEPRIAANINDDFVPVRVNAARRPRVRERYNMGGFPSTVFVTPDGEHIAGATFLEPDGFRQVLQRVRETWDDAGADAGSVPRALSGGEPPAAPLSGDIEGLVAGQLADQYDSEHAGWGTSEKFPLPETVSFALKRDRDRALRTLDAIRRHLVGDDGGCFRFAHGRDWSDPQTERTLSVNAGMLAAFAHAYLTTGDDEYRGAATGVLDYLTETLWTGAAFGAGETPDGGVDDAAYADGNALAADALLSLAAYTGDDRATRYAERTLDYIADELLVDDTVRHYAGAAAPVGLLADRARVTGALTTAGQVLDPAYLEPARAVADRAIADLQDDTGAFVDGPETGAGLLDEPLRPIDDTAVMADALVDLSYLTGEARYRDAARDAVAAFAGAAERMGVQVAGYATAAARLSTRPLVIRVADDPGSELHRAALRMADHEKVVAVGADGDPGTAWLDTADGDTDAVATPSALAALVADTAQ